MVTKERCKESYREVKRGKSREGKKRYYQNI